MTTTAKILVVLNLLLGVLFLGFSAASFNARLGLQSRITTLEKEKKTADDKAAVEQQQNNKLTNDASTLTNNFNLLKKQNEEEKKQAANQIQNLGDEASNYRKQADVTTQRIKQVADEMTQRKEEIDQARKQNQDLVSKNVQASNELSKSRDEIQELKNQVERLNDKLRIAEDKHRKLLNYLTIVKFNLPSPEELDNPVSELTPPPAVEGVVSEVRDGGKIMEITLGENDGMRPGHRLVLWRPGKYLGEVQVIYTTPDKAVIRPVEAPLTAPPAKGDRVGSSTMLNRG